MTFLHRLTGHPPFTGHPFEWSMITSNFLLCLNITPLSTAATHPDLFL